MLYSAAKSPYYNFLGTTSKHFYHQYFEDDDDDEEGLLAR